MALDWTAIDTAIKAWLVAAVPSVTWYRGDQDIPRPALPCGQWRWTNVGERLTAQGRAADDSWISTSGTTSLRQALHHRRHTLEIQVYASAVTGSTAAVLLDAALLELQTEGRRYALEQAGLVIRSDGSALDATALLGYAAESRAVADLAVYTADSATEDVGRIDTVTPLTGTLET